MLRVEWEDTPESYFYGLPESTQREIKDGLDTFAREPNRVPYWLRFERLDGTRTGWRFRTKDNYTVIFAVVGKKLKVIDLGYGHEPYKRMGGP